MSRASAKGAIAVAMLSCAVPADAQQEAPGTWFLNARQTGGAPVYFVVGGTENAPPQREADVHFGWRWSEGARDILVYPTEPGTPPLSDAGVPDRWSFHGGEYGFPAVGVGPAHELWLLRDSTSRAQGWAALLDVVEAAYRQRRPTQAEMNVVMELGSLGLCTVFSAPIPDSTWHPLSLRTGARRGARTAPFLAEPASAGTGASGREVRIRRFVRWLRGPAGGNCRAQPNATLQLFPLPGTQEAPADRGFSLTVNGLTVQPVDFDRLVHAPWLPGDRTLASDTALGVTAQAPPDPQENLCASAAVHPLCLADLERRKALYTAFGAHPADSLRVRLADACDAVMRAWLPEASAASPCADPTMWRDSVGGLYRTFYAGDWLISTTPRIISRLDGPQVAWIVEDTTGASRSWDATLPGGKTATVAARGKGGGLLALPVWQWLIIAAAVVIAVVAVKISRKRPPPRGEATLDAMAIRHLPFLEGRVRAASTALVRLSRDPLHMALLGRAAYARSEGGVGPKGRSALRALRDTVSKRTHEYDNTPGTDTLGPLAYALAGWYLDQDTREMPGLARTALARLAHHKSGSWKDSGIRPYFAQFLVGSRLEKVLTLAKDPVVLVTAAARWAKHSAASTRQTALDDLHAHDTWRAVLDADRQLRSDPWVAAMLGYVWKQQEGTRVTPAAIKRSLIDQQRHQPKANESSADIPGSGQAGVLASDAVEVTHCGWLLCGYWLGGAWAVTPSREIWDLLWEVRKHSLLAEGSDPVPDPMAGKRKDPLAWLLLGYLLTLGDTPAPQLERDDRITAENRKAPAPPVFQELRSDTVSREGLGPHISGTALAGPTSDVLTAEEDSDVAEAEELGHEGADLPKKVAELVENADSLSAEVRQLRSERDALVNVYAELLRQVETRTETVRQLNTQAQDLARDLESRTANAEHIIKKLAEEHVGKTIAQWHTDALRQVQSDAETTLRTVYQPLLEREEALRPLLEKEDALTRAERLLHAVESHGAALDRLLGIAEGLPKESLVTLLDPSGPFAGAETRRVSREEGDRIYGQVARNLSAQSDPDREALTRAAHAGAQLGAWITTLWQHFIARSGAEEFVPVLAGRLHPTAQEEWYQAYRELQAFAQYEAVCLQRLHTLLRDEERFFGLSLNRGSDIPFLRAAGLAEEGADARQRLRAFLAPRKQAGPLDRVILNLQYLVEAFPREGLRLSRDEREDFMNRLHEACDRMELPHDFHGIAGRFADGLGLRYHPVPYYESRIDMDPHRSVIRQSVGALSLTGRLGSPMRTDPQNVVRLDRPFFFDGDTYYSGYAYVAREHA